MQLPIRVCSSPRGRQASVFCFSQVPEGLLREVRGTARCGLATSSWRRRPRREGVRVHPRQSGSAELQRATAANGPRVWRWSPKRNGVEARDGVERSSISSQPRMRGTKRTRRQSVGFGPSRSFRVYEPWVPALSTSSTSSSPNSPAYGQPNFKLGQAARRPPAPQEPPPLRDPP